MLDFLLQQYRDLLNDLDKSCKAVLINVIETPCRKGCYDCCKQLFPLSLIEAYYINQGFQTLGEEAQNALKTAVEKSRKAVQGLNLSQFETFSDSLEDIAEARNALTKALQSTKISCPLLALEDGQSGSNLPKGLCRLYPYRNHDCRIHGVSFDPGSGEIVGCFRHARIFNTPDLRQNFTSHAVPSNHLYKEKSKLDSLLTVELGQDPNLKEPLKYCYYFTTPYMPLQEAFASRNWPEFFREKLSGARGTQDARSASTRSAKKYSLIIDAPVSIS